MKLLILSFGLIINFSYFARASTGTCIKYNAQIEDRIREKIAYLIANGRKYLEVDDAFAITKSIFSLNIGPLIEKSCENNSYNPAIFQPSNKAGCIKTLNSLWPTFITQMIHETAWFTSELSEKNNFAGLALDGMTGRGFSKEYQKKTTLYFDDGMQKKLLSLQSVDDGILTFFRYYLNPSWKIDYYGSCFKEYSLSKLKIKEASVTFLNCVGRSWAKAGKNGVYGTIAFGGKNSTTYTFVEKYLKTSCAKN